MEPEVLNYLEGCKLLGVGRAAMDTLVADEVNPIPTVQLGKRKGFLRSAVMEWLKAGGTIPKTEAPQDVAPEPQPVKRRPGRPKGSKTRRRDPFAQDPAQQQAA